MKEVMNTPDYHKSLDSAIKHSTISHNEMIKRIHSQEAERLKRWRDYICALWIGELGREINERIEELEAGR